MLHRLSSARPAARAWSGKISILAAAAALSACAAKQIDTQTFVDVPVEVPRLLVVYQPNQAAAAEPVAEAADKAAGEGITPAAATVAATPAATMAARQAQRERVSDALGDSLEERLPSGLAAAGINALFVRATSVTTVLNSKTARASVSHVLYLRIQDDKEDCGPSGNCSYRVTLRATLLRSGAAPTLWRTDLQEAYFTSSRIDVARFDDLSEHLARAVAPMLRMPAGESAPR
ncbi:hypothetical protein J8I26_06370 [Herbaspirillum sp. LeCh32-8]|uniref:hypothetical protein n=1 Tax=Herbaspirillum sp. LeCh32-8 TaxID=2821356 RepID=UPI001AE75C8E|nr:hypothetical protein [Herbaspirillum sp. LeCh32-8]MBP0597718.1 hypothetical protein [Herbaspirillum sp. LeCh32-8]